MKGKSYTSATETTTSVTITQGLEHIDPDDIGPLQAMYHSMRQTSVETGAIEDVLTFGVMAHYFAILNLETKSTTTYTKSNRAEDAAKRTASARLSVSGRLDSLSEEEKIRRWRDTLHAPETTSQVADDTTIPRDLAPSPSLSQHPPPFLPVQPLHLSRERSLRAPSSTSTPALDTTPAPWTSTSSTAFSPFSSPFTSAAAVQGPDTDVSMSNNVPWGDSSSPSEHHEDINDNSPHAADRVDNLGAGTSPPGAAEDDIYMVDDVLDLLSTRQRDQSDTAPANGGGNVDLDSFDDMYHDDPVEHDGSGAATPTFRHSRPVEATLTALEDELDYLQGLQQGVPIPLTDVRWDADEIWATRNSRHSPDTTGVDYPSWTGFAGGRPDFHQPISARNPPTAPRDWRAGASARGWQQRPVRRAPDYMEARPSRVFNPGRIGGRPFSGSDSDEDEAIPPTTTTATTKFIGFIYLMASPNFDDPLHLGELTFGIYVEDMYVNEAGVITAIEEVLGKTFKDPTCHRVQALVARHSEETDWKQRRLLTRSGFTFEGTRRRAFFSPLHQEYRDVSYWGILDTDWLLDQTNPRNRLRPKDEADELTKRHEREVMEFYKGMDNRLKRSTSTETIKRKYSRAVAEGIDFDDGLTVSESIPSSASIAPSVRAPPSVASSSASSASYHSLGGGVGRREGSGSPQLGGSPRSEPRPPSSPSLSSVSSSWTDTDSALLPIDRLEADGPQAQASPSPPSRILRRRSARGSTSGSSHSGWSVVDGDDF